ncbi:hypothetical protein DFJ74DRAFT_187967 [Hyaloraphidium curvatum]|nr:hypothetical protein DFJ74DRAFT_187967 [Hyaloraphidium curvatum]
MLEVRSAACERARWPTVPGAARCDANPWGRSGSSCAPCGAPARPRIQLARAGKPTARGYAVWCCSSPPQELRAGGRPLRRRGRHRRRKNACEPRHAFASLFERARSTRSGARLPVLQGRVDRTRSPITAPSLRPLAPAYPCARHLNPFRRAGLPLLPARGLSRLRVTCAGDVGATRCWPRRTTLARRKRPAGSATDRLRHMHAECYRCRCFWAGARCPSRAQSSLADCAGAGTRGSLWNASRSSAGIQSGRHMAVPSRLLLGRCRRFSFDWSRTNGPVVIALGRFAIPAARGRAALGRGSCALERGLCVSILTLQ